MSWVAAWLAAREPAPPAQLAEALSAVLAEEMPRARSGGRESGLSEALTELGRACLEQALARPGRERESAYRLLEADALLTYACEAALEEADPVGSLRRIVVSACRSR